MLTKRFLHYVSYDTQSDDTSLTIPSTKKQLELSKVLVEELHNLGVSDAFLDEYGVVYARIEALNASEDAPTIGLNAHVDTALELSGANVKPRIIKNYDGKTITLNEELDIYMDPSDFPELNEVIGDDLIVTDGTTLLGGDDKAGIAIIMSAVEKVLQNKEKLTAHVALSFTPDEEIGRGVENFNLDHFKATYAYTVDGGNIAYANYENFNAASANVCIHGKAIHPGTAKDKMINASTVAMEFHSLLDPNAVPEKTSNYEGFNHLTSMKGGVEQATLNYIIRNHNEIYLQEQKDSFHHAAQIINKKFGERLVKVEIEDSYKNMAALIKEDRRCLDRLEKAYELLNLPLSYIPIRGGTDGAGLSYQGVLTPNLGTGGYYAHGKYEFVSINQMKTMVEIIYTLLTL